MLAAREIMGQRTQDARTGCLLDGKPCTTTGIARCYFINTRIVSGMLRAKVG